MNRFTPLLIIVLLSACSSKKKQGILGTYFGAGGRAKIELLQDSTAHSSAKIPGSKNLLKQNGTFSIRNDSIFINWESGKQVGSRLEEKNGERFFKIGATNYKQEE